MLIEIHIHNFALIDELHLEPTAAFTVLTGETGAGKSIIVDAVSFVIGERSGTDVIRTGADKCVVEALFDVSGCPETICAAQDQGIDVEENTIVVSREISQSGRSTCRLNGRMITAADLRKITASLIDIHGQHEHQSLFNSGKHIDIYDNWLGTDALDLRARTCEIFAELTSVKGERKKLQTDERERARMLDLYRFQISEIQGAGLQVGEEEELVQERNRLANAEKLFEVASSIHDYLGDDDAAVDNLGKAALAIEKAAAMDSGLNSIAENLNSALISAQEALEEIRDYRESIEANPDRLSALDERSELLRNLKRKYGTTIEEVIAYGKSLQGLIDDLEHADDRCIDLTKRIDKLESELDSVCTKLSVIRDAGVARFEKSIENELSDLAMERTRFVVAISRQAPGANGADDLEFMISPNPGEPVKPLAKIASGGEISRISLALKTVTGGVDVPTLIFDEVDAGIGGVTAQVLGDKLAALANRCQVLCVTHLPQIASKASGHFAIEKRVESQRSFIRLIKLNTEQRVVELTRMLGGQDAAGTAAMHAREMLSRADHGNRQA